MDAPRNALFLALIGLFWPVLCACAPTGSDAGARSVRVVVSIAPLAWLVEMVAPEAEVTVLVPPGISPHNHEMTPGQAAALAGADVVVLVGAGLEPASVEGALGTERTDRVVLRMADALAEGGGKEADEHEEIDHDHAHSVDPHLWLDPALMRDAAMRLAGALDRDAAGALEAIDGVDREYAVALAGHAGAQIVGVHDAWSRLAARYGLRADASIMARFEIEATPGAIERAAQVLRAGGPAVVVVEPQMDATLARRLSELSGAPLVEMDPVGGRDWAATMRTNLARLESGLARAGAPAGAAQ